MKPFTRAESALVLAVVGLVLLAVLAPALPQSQAYHHFADTRALLGVPRGWDVLSNVGFLLFGVAGLRALRATALDDFKPALRAAAGLFFVGLLCTAAGSSYYHWAPDDARLVFDRLGMVVAFAGMLGMAAADRVSERAGYALTVLGLALGPASVAWWHFSGSVTPYGVMQFGGITLAMGCMLAPARGAGPQWWMMAAAYGAAKLLETFDPQVLALTGGLVSGHTLKHLFSAAAAYAVLAPRRTA